MCLATSTRTQSLNARQFSLSVNGKNDHRLIARPGFNADCLCAASSLAAHHHSRGKPSLSLQHHVPPNPEVACCARNVRDSTRHRRHINNMTPAIYSTMSRHFRVPFLVCFHTPRCVSLQNSSVVDRIDDVASLLQTAGLCGKEPRAYGCLGLPEVSGKVKTLRTNRAMF